MWKSNARFIVAAAGRRSGKTETAKRKLVQSALRFARFKNGRFIACAPVRDQAKEIYWTDLKDLVPAWAVAGISESELTIFLRHGPKIQVIGMDKPHRSEGGPIDGAIMDEYADMKADAFSLSVRPALDTIGRPGWAWFIGKAKGRNHFWKLFNEAPTRKGWEAYTWPSSDILTPEAIEAARQDLDELSFQQEYEASFLNFSGRAYYPFDRVTHCELGLKSRYYDKRSPLLVCFDFNVEPGVAAIGQEILHQTLGPVTAWMGEVWIPQNSNTPAVCRKIAQDWGKHEGDVLIYGDATGGARGSAKVDGSDWDLISAELRPKFGQRFKMRVPDANPPERVRVNAVNRRLRTASGKIRMLLDQARCGHLAVDLEGVTLLAGGSGEIDKGDSKKNSKKNSELTHISDAIGYSIVERHPVLEVISLDESL